MDIGDEGVADPSAEFGDLFEGQTVAFESELGGHADDVLGVIGHGHNVRGHPIHHHRVSSHHPSDHEILSTNMSFGSDEYLQHQQIVIDGDSSEYMVTVPDANLQLRGENEGPPDSVQQIYVHSNHEQMDGVVGTSISSAVQMYNYETFTQSAATVLITSPSTRTNEGTKIKEKVKRVKNVEYFTNENMKMYLKRRGFCRVSQIVSIKVKGSSTSLAQARRKF
ncbi:unnamed protein product [Orchesella dallaii]|uniref:Uncharacterized protein n=1 Tax=Orchesella dallaii TaxID=48710 RepID=A0ABP1PZH5_9HEXA